MAIKTFNQQGFTHLRDMSGDLEQWQALNQLEDSRDLTLYIDQNFIFEKPEDFSRALDLAVKTSREKCPHLRSRGVKFYLDGALGSEGAALSQNYGDSDKNGFLIWSPEQVQEWLLKSWEQGQEVSVHTIGDRASDLVVQQALRLWDRGIKGFLNLEHAEVLRSETLHLLEKRSVRLYMQPCHWLSDRAWLKSKLGSLEKSAFQWRLADQLGIPLSWGSDAPIERPSLFDNQKALSESPPAIPDYPHEWWKPHEHPDPKWGSTCLTTLESTQVVQVEFDGQRIFDRGT